MLKKKKLNWNYQEILTKTAVHWWYNGTAYKTCCINTLMHVNKTLSVIRPLTSVYWRFYIKASTVFPNRLQSMYVLRPFKTAWLVIRRSKVQALKRPSWLVIVFLRKAQYLHINKVILYLKKARKFPNKPSKACVISELKIIRITCD